MEFPPLNFQSMNETAVREEILGPLLKYLGYRSGGTHSIEYEKSLAYPRAFIGRHKSKDPELRGRADYVCTAGGRVCWVVEAKAPNEALDDGVEQQAYSYAVHPEVRAVYFMLSNGRELKLFLSSNAPGSPPIFACAYGELGAHLHAIQNTLAPENVLQDFPAKAVDVAAPLGPGLRSTAKILSGRSQIFSTSPAIPKITDLTMSIVEGSVKRNDAQQIEVRYKTRAPVVKLQQFNERFGLDSLILLSEDASISGDPQQGTIFSNSTQIEIPAGQMVFDIGSWAESQNVFRQSIVGAQWLQGYLSGKRFHGRFVGQMAIYVEDWGRVPGLFEIVGEVELQLE